MHEIVPTDATRMHQIVPTRATCTHQIVPTGAKHGCNRSSQQEQHGHTRSSQQKPQQHTMSAAYGQEPTARHWPLEITTMTRHAPQLHITVPVMGRCAAPEPQQTNRLSVDTGSRTTQGCDAHDSSLYSSPLLDDEYTRHDDDNSSKQLRHHHTTVTAEIGRKSLNTYVKTRRRVSWPS